MTHLGTYRVFAVLTVFLTVSLTGNAVSAETVAFEKEYTYKASEIDSKVTSRAIALESAKRLLLEDIGNYLISRTRVKDLKLSKDTVTTLAAGIVKTEAVAENWDGENYYIKVGVRVAPAEVADSLDMLRRDSQKIKEMEEVRLRADGALKDMERLKSEAAKADWDKEREYVRDAGILSLADWFTRGSALLNSRDYQGAIDAYVKVIELDPEYAEAFDNRGVAYSAKGQYDEAIDDFSYAIYINPDYSEAYLNRANTYAVKGRYDEALIDYNNAISINPDYAYAYLARGLAYYVKEQYYRSIDDYTRAISLSPDNAEVYYYRGNTYYTVGQYSNAIDDYTKAIALKPDYSEAYSGRGSVYKAKGQLDMALSNFTKSCELGYEDGCKKAKVLENWRNLQPLF